MDSEELDRIIRGKNINFLIGAGASIPMYPSLSFGENYPTFEDIASNNHISTQAKSFMYMFYFTKWIKPMNDSLEKFKETLTIIGYKDKLKVYDDYKRLIRWMYEYMFI